MIRPAAVMAATISAVVLVAGCAGPTTARRPGERPSSAAATAALEHRAGLAACPHATRGRAGQLPDLRLPCLGGGNPVPIARVGGTPMIVNIWASWCRPCYQEMPAIQRVYAEAGGRLRVLGVDTTDSRDRALHAAIDTGVRYPSVFDPQHRVATALGRNVQPTTVFVRSDGSIAKIRTGPVGDAGQLAVLVRRYLGVAL